MREDFGLIDQDTPENKYNVIAATGEEWDLVFSDEFNEPGRTFYPVDDPYWEAVDLVGYNHDALPQNAQSGQGAASAQKTGGR